MPATETSIWIALRARLAALTLTPTLPIAWPNEAFTPPEDGPQPGAYLEVRHMPNTASRLFIGHSSPDRHHGILQVSVCHRLELAATQGETAPREVGGQVADHFAKGLQLSYGGVRVRITKRPDVGAGFRDAARTRWVVPVSISYEAFA